MIAPRSRPGFALALCLVAAIGIACADGEPSPGDTGTRAAPPASAIEAPAAGENVRSPAAGDSASPHVAAVDPHGSPDAAPPGTTSSDASAAANDGATPSSGGANGARRTSNNDPRSINDNGAAIAAVTPSPTPFVSVPSNETIVAIPTATRTPTRTPTSTPQPGGGPSIDGCSIFPSNNPWNADISAYPLHANSANYINNILAGSGTDKVHPDFGSNPGYGIPFIVVPQNEPLVPINFTDYGDESDPGPYPIPLDAPNEGGGDRHVIAVQQGSCMLYELFHAFPQTNHWDASSGAVFDLSSNALRPEGWTSADAAGLPILPGLVRYDEVQSGVIRHALRFTVQSTQRGYIHPAVHWASSSSDPNRPPMGLRLRLKASYDISGFTGNSRVILEALKTYGMIVADNGSNWFISGARDPRWDDDDLNQLKNVPGTAFEAVYTGEIVTP